MSKVVGVVIGAAEVVVGAITHNPKLIIQGVVTIGTTLLAPSGPKKQERQASVTSLTLGEGPREAIFGTAVTAGSLVDAFDYGGQFNDDWEVLVIDVADHRTDALLGVFVNDAYVAYAGDGPVAGYNGQLEVYYRSGTATQTVPAILTAHGPGWTASDNGAGVSYVVVAYKADAQDAKNPVWPAGRPSFLWHLRGARCYIPRKDGSLAGGSGTHRRDDPSTWEWTDNLIDCRYNWVRGLYACDRITDPTMLLVGRGLTATEAPPENSFAPANLCDEAMAGGNKRYAIGGVVMADQPYIDVEEEFALACGGIVVQPGGSVEIEPGQAKAPVFSFTDDDLIVGSKVDGKDFLSRANDEWVNTVIPRYVEPTLKWADHAAAIRRVDADVIADGGSREATLSIGLVTVEEQAGRIGEIARRLGRLWKRYSVTLGPAFCGVEEGDWGVWTSATYLKGASITFRVESYSLDEKWQNTLVLREIGASCFTDAAFIADHASAAQQAPSDRTAAPGATAWTLTPQQLTTGTSEVPALVIEGAVDNPYAQSVRFEYWRSDGVTAPAAVTHWTGASLASPGVTRREITSVAPGDVYYAAVSYLVNGIPGNRRILGPVTAGALRAEVSSFAGYLTNESHDIAAASDGTIASFAGAGGNFVVLNGTTDVTASATFAVMSSSGVTVTIDATGAYAPTAMSADQGTAVLRATIDGVAIDKVYSIAKSRAGATGATGTTGATGSTGAPAKTIYVQSNLQTISFDASGTLVAGQTITFIATKQNTANTVTWTMKDSLGNALSAASFLSATTGDSVTMSGSAFASAIAVNATTGVTVIGTITADGISDQISVVKVKEGATGATGAAGSTGATGSTGTPGVSARLIDIQKAAISVSADFTGAVKSGQLPIANKATMMDGSSDASASTTWSVSGSGATATIDTSGNVSLTGVTALTGGVTVTGVYAGVTYTKSFATARNDDPQPPTTATSVSDNGTTSVDSTTSFATPTSGIWTVAANGSGQIIFDLGASAFWSTTSGTKTFDLGAGCKYRVAGSGAAWTTIGAGELSDSESAIPGEPGTISISLSGYAQTGLTAGASYEVAFFAEKLSGTQASINMRWNFTARQS